MSERSVPSAPFAVDIAITGRCNLRCKYCFYADEMIARQDLPAERWLAFFEELGRLGIQRLCVTGGEALTRPDLFKLIDGIVANRMRYTILTNGTLLTEEVLAHFAVGKRRLRLDQVQVSIDGSRAAVHNQSRPGSFDRALQGLRLLAGAHMPVTVRVTVNQHNLDDLEEVARLLLEEIGLPSFDTDEANPCGIIFRQEEPLMLTPEQRRRAVQILAALSARYPGRIGGQSGPMALIREYGAVEEALAAGRPALPGCGTLGSCHGAFMKMAVLHDGTIVPCHNLATFALGTIGVDDLQQIWRDHPVMVALRQRQTIPLRTLATCQDCPYTAFCTGGCPAGALALEGEVNARNPMVCYRLYQETAP